MIVLWSFLLPFTCRKWWNQIQRRLILLLYTLLYPSGYHICLSSPKQPSWVVCWFSQEFVTCLIEHLSQIWPLWCNILTLSDVRNTRVWNRIFWFWLVSFYLANDMLYLFSGILRILFWKPDFGGNLSKKVIESRYISHFLIIGQIIVIEFTLLEIIGDFKELLVTLSYWKCKENYRKIIVIEKIHLSPTPIRDGGSTALYTV